MGNRCRRRSKWRGGRRSRWSYLSSWCTADRSPSMRTVRIKLLSLLLSPHFNSFWVSFYIYFCRFQRSGRRGLVTGTCPPSQRRRQRSLRHAAEGNASCSTTAVSFQEFIPEDRGWTRPTTTLCPCGSVAPSWSRSISRLQVSVQI